jgi:glutamate synthase domain-containing protein 2
MDGVSSLILTNFYNVIIVVYSDYAPADELDHYDSALLAKDDDDELFESMEKRIRDRNAAEEALDAFYAKQRQREEEAEGDLENFGFGRQDDSDDDDDGMDNPELIEGAEKALNLEAFDSPLREWIAEERTRREISRRFRKFLSTYYVGIEEVTRWVKKHEHFDPPVPLPSNLRVTPPIYPPKIR